MLDCRISASTLRFAVFGKSLPHTWSPQIHNSLFHAAGIDAVYFAVTVPDEQIGSAADVFRSCFSGFNVTIPYKERIIPFLDEVDDAVRVCGAVNTVENRDGRLIGHITDGLGMLRAIEEGGISTDGVDALILGGGGAARVAAYEFLVRKGRVTIAVRNLEKGKRLAKELADTQVDGMARIQVSTLDDVRGAHDILINCTPVGMYPECDASHVAVVWFQGAALCLMRCIIQEKPNCSPWRVHRVFLALKVWACSFIRPSRRRNTGLGSRALLPRSSKDASIVCFLNPCDIAG